MSAVKPIFFNYHLNLILSLSVSLRTDFGFFVVNVRPSAIELNAPFLTDTIIYHTNTISVFCL